MDIFSKVKPEREHFVDGKGIFLKEATPIYERESLEKKTRAKGRSLQKALIMPIIYVSIIFAGIFAQRIAKI